MSLSKKFKFNGHWKGGFWDPLFWEIVVWSCRLTETQNSDETSFLTILLMILRFGKFLELDKIFRDWEKDQYVLRTQTKDVIP